MAYFDLSFLWFENNIIWVIVHTIGCTCVIVLVGGILISLVFMFYNNEHKCYYSLTVLLWGSCSLKISNWTRKFNWNFHFSACNWMRRKVCKIVWCHIIMERCKYFCVYSAILSPSLVVCLVVQYNVPFCCSK